MSTTKSTTKSAATKSAAKKAPAKAAPKSTTKAATKSDDGNGVKGKRMSDAELRAAITAAVKADPTLANSWGRCLRTLRAEGKGSGGHLRFRDLFQLVVGTKPAVIAAAKSAAKSTSTKSAAKSTTPARKTAAKSAAKPAAKPAAKSTKRVAK